MFHELLQRSGIATRESTDGAVAIGDDETFYLVTEEHGWFIVERRSRGLSEGVRFRAQQIDDVERFLVLEFGDEQRGLELPILAWVSVPPPVAPTVKLVPDGAGWVSFQRSDEDTRVVMPYVGIAEISAAHAFSHVIDASIVQLRESFEAIDGAPALSAFMKPGDDRSRPAAVAVAYDELSSEARDRADRGIALFQSLAARSGKSFDDPVNIVPFAGGLAVVRAIRGGGKIFVAEDGSVMYRGSSYTFERALEEFRAGQRTPLESFR